MSAESRTSPYRKLPRNQLERLLADAEQALLAETDSDARRLLHDLQLHQIELEISNRELVAAQSAVEESREQFVTLFDFAPIAYLRLDRTAQVVQANLAAARLFGRVRSRLEGQLLTTLLHHDHRLGLLGHIQAAFDDVGVSTAEFQSRPADDGDVRNLRLDSTATTWSDGAPSALVTVTDITDLRTAERRLRESHHELSTLIAAAPTGIGIVRERMLQSVSPRLLELLDYHEAALIGRSTRMLYPTEAEYARVGRLKYAQINRAGVGEIETVMRRRDGTLVDVLLRSAALDAHDLAAGVVFTVLDITERKRIDNELHQARRLLDLSLAGGDIGSYTADLPGGPITVDERYLAMLGHRPGELPLDRKTWMEMIHPHDRAGVEARLAPVLAGELDAFEADYRMGHRLGHWVWIMDRARVHQRDTAAGTLHMAGTHLNITRRHEIEEQVAYLVEHDALTDLLNRRGITRRLERMQATAERSGRPFALAVLDLDHFKEINDGFGHPIGDRVLHGVAETLRAALRTTDVLGRWGGDELIIATPDSTEAAAMTTIERLRADVGEHLIDADGQHIRVTLSAGLAVFQPDRDDLAAVIARADGALYQAKRLGRDRMEFSGSEDGRKAISIATMIRTALREDRIEIRAHPIFDLRTGVVVGEEFAARILQRDDGTMDIGAYLYDVALKLSLMHQIDRRLIEAAAARLQAARPPGNAPARRLAFAGVSADLLSRPDLVEHLAEGVPSASSSDRNAGLVLTIDQAQVDPDDDELLDGLNPFLRRGCKLALDDVGGKASTHRFLARLPASFVILSRDLVRQSAESPRARAVLSGIIHSVRDLGCISVARDVDDPATQERLAEQGVDLGLGETVEPPSP